MATELLTLAAAAPSLRELIAAKAAGHPIDAAVLEDTLYRCDLNLRDFRRMVETFSARRRASQVLKDPLGASLTDGSVSFAVDREAMRVRCEAERDALQKQLDELSAPILQAMSDAMAPLAELDRRIGGLRHAAAVARQGWQRTRDDALAILRTSADPAIDERITELTQRVAELQHSLQTAQANISGVSVRELRSKIAGLQFELDAEAKLLGPRVSGSSDHQLLARIEILTNSANRQEQAEAECRRTEASIAEAQREIARLQDSKLDPDNFAA